MYVKIPAVRASISFGDVISYISRGELVNPKEGTELFSGTADVLFKFASQSLHVLKTTGYTRIRLPVIVREKNGGFRERIVFFTSHDRTLVAANSSRVVNQLNFLNDYEHNTPLVLLLSNGCKKLSVEVNSGGKTYKHDINTTDDGAKFSIPDDLQIKSNNFSPKLFDAELQLKKSKH